MKAGVRTGVFLCRCGEVIGGRLDMSALEDRMKGAAGAVCVRSHSRYCLRPGLKQLAETVREHELNRVLIGACSDRIMKKKFSRTLGEFGFLDCQIEVVNLKDHIALVHDEPSAELTRKAAALLGGAAASLGLVDPVAPLRAPFEGPAIILGGGVSGFAAAKELARHGMETSLVTDYTNADEVLDGLPGKFPGARIRFGHLKSMLEGVFSNPLVSLVPDLSLEHLDGHVGDYRLGFRRPDGGVNEIKGSVIILALDREYVSGKLPSAGKTGQVMDQVKFEDLLGRAESLTGSVVFWIDGADEQENRDLAFLSAWNNSRYLVDNYPQATPVVLYPDDIRLPLTGADLVWARKRKINFSAYDPGFHPTVWSDHLTFVSTQDRMKHEIGWDTLVVSAASGPPAPKTLELIRFLPIFSAESELKRPSLMLKPDQEPAQRAILTGSAERPCSLDEALLQGKAAARKVLDLKKKAMEGGLAEHLVVVAVDQNLCEGCGLCDEVCNCGAVENVIPGKGPLPRRVDIHACDGGGSCAAACPYQAMTVLNNSTQQLEARIKAVLSQMNENDALGFACNWGGQGAAEMAAIKGLKYPSRLFMVTVRCLGGIDPTILSMAFLNGANHIMLAGCPPAASCHYGYGIDHTWFRVLFIEKLLSLAGLERRRLSLGYVDVNEPEVFVRMARSFLDEADRLGPIERTPQCRQSLLAVHATLLRPRVRWVLGVGLRRPSELEFPNIEGPAAPLEELFSDVLEEEYLSARIIGVIREVSMNPPSIAGVLGVPVQKISPLLTELSDEKRIVLTGWKDRYPQFISASPLRN